MRLIKNEKEMVKTKKNENQKEDIDTEQILVETHHRNLISEDQCQCIKKEEKKKEKIIRNRSRSSIVLACVYMNKTERQTPASQRKKMS